MIAPHLRTAGVVKGFGRRPGTEAEARAEGPASESLRGRKPRAAEMATARGLGLWGFEGRAFGGARKSAGVVGVVGHVRGDLRLRIEGGSPRDRPTENRFGCGGRRGRERKHAAATSWQILIVSEGGDRGGGHDVSILAASALKLRGCAPRAKAPVSHGVQNPMILRQSDASRCPGLQTPHADARRPPRERFSPSTLSGHTRLRRWMRIWAKSGPSLLKL